MSTCVESTNAIVSPSTRDSTCAAAADRVECPDGYSGNGGVANNVAHLGSNTRCMYVTGRSTSDLYFSFQQPMNASAIAIDVSVYNSAAASALRLRRVIIWLTTLTQWKPGVPVATGLSAQNSATSRLAGVIVFTES